MTLPGLNAFGDLPQGIHMASLDEVIARFGTGTERRRVVSQTLDEIYRLAAATNYLDRFLVFGSFVSDAEFPNDVDVILVMKNDFQLETCASETQILFDHGRCDDELGASVFWIRPELLFGQSIEEFLEFWQQKRDGGRRGIVEIKP